jgi:hypothetical protein
MAIAYIILAHRMPDQVARLVDRLSTSEDRVFVHLDKRSDVAPYAAAFARLPQPPTMLRRVPVRWAGWGHVRATLIGLGAVLRAPQEFSHIVLLTGQDYPIRSTPELQAFFAEHQGQSFLSWSDGTGPRMTDQERGANEQWYWSGDMSRLMSWCVTIKGRRWHFPRLDGTGPALPRRLPHGLKPYQGLAYWAITPQAAAYCLRTMRRRPGVRWFFQWVHIPDENLFQMLLLNSQLRDTLVNEDLRYLYWDDVHPKTIGVDDIEPMLASKKLFARKFDLDVNAAVMDLLDGRPEG